MSNTDRHPVAGSLRRPQESQVRRGRRRGVLGLALLGLAGLVAGLAGGQLPANAGTPPRVRAAGVPGVPSGLPAGVEDLAGYVAQVSCDPTPKPGVLALGRLLSTTYPGTGYVVSRACGSEPISSEHVDGRALDWQVSARNATQKAQAQALLGWLFATDGNGRPFAMARRLGVMYVIWNDRIWGSYNPLAGWRPYSTCAAHPETASDPVCHRDRLHLSLSWPGAMGRTSFWTRSVAGADYGPCRPRDLNWAPPYSGRNPTPCPGYPALTAPPRASANDSALVRYSGATVSPGDDGPVVAALQRSLGIVADGDFGPFTADAVIALQRRHGLPTSGALDAATWRVLLGDTIGLLTVQPTPAPVGRPTTGALTRYLGTRLSYGSRGAAVMALQRRLGVTVSGWFGPLTRARVVTFQASVKLPATGVVERTTWKALGA